MASYKGLYVACACFNVLDAKDRKVVVKSLKDALKEMFSNKIGHLFVLHILNNLDDTQLSKKKIISELLKSVDELFNDKYYQQIIIGMLQPQSKRYFMPEEIDALEAYADKSTSKKSQQVRRQELIKGVLKPYATFLEENISYYVMEVNKNHVLRCLLQVVVECKDSIINCFSGLSRWEYRFSGWTLASSLEKGNFWERWLR